MIATLAATHQKNGVASGHASLEVKLVFNESTVISAYATSPMKLLTPRSRGQSVWACTSSFGGGLVAGDQTRLDLMLRYETKCFMGTQASTKIYRNPYNRPCSHITEARLEPGSQAHIINHLITENNDVDTEEVVGWKNGLFIFHDASMETIMRQVERWYDARVVFKGQIKQQFNATILRSEPLSKLLHLLELNGYVHFKIENKTIYVLP